MSALLRQAAHRGGRDALAAFGLPPPAQPSPQSVGFKTPSAVAAASGLPKAAKPPSIGTAPEAGKTAFAVGMGASASTTSAGATRGQPADAGRRQRSAIDRAMRAHEEGFSTSSMPDPGDVPP